MIADRAPRGATHPALAPLAAAALATAAPGGDVPPPDFTVAFFGDQGLGADARQVLELVAAEGADAVLHLGDFDYEDDPAAWEAQINDVLGADFPYFAAVGNHDMAAFYGGGGYQEHIEARMERLGIPWSGDLGVRSSFAYEGIRFVLTAPGLFGIGDLAYAPYIRARLAQDDSIWRISGWHVLMREMQVGGKLDQSGWGVYEESRRGGAIVATAHEHSYARTHALADCSDQVVASFENHFTIGPDDPDTPSDEGVTFVFHSGLGGRSIRDQERCAPHEPPYGCNGEWASVYTEDQAANYGALFGVFNYQGDPCEARFYFKDVDGTVVDEFFVRSQLGSCAGQIACAESDYVGEDGGDWFDPAAWSGGEVPGADTLADIRTSSVRISQPGAVACDVRIADGGELVVDAGGELAVSEELTVASGGALSGSGTVAGDVVNRGEVSPGGFAAPGRLAIDGSYRQTASGVLAIELGGREPASEHDVLEVTGQVELDGLLSVALLGPDPQFTEEFAAVSAGAEIDGAFADLDLPPLQGPLHVIVDAGAGSITLRVGIDGPMIAWLPVGRGDLDGDGRSDVVCRDPASGHNVVLFIESEPGQDPSFAGGGALPPVAGAHHKVAGTGDFDGDGRSDLLWRDHATGANETWLMDGWDRLDGSGPIPSINLDWKFAGTGDFNADSASDILWRHAGNGKTRIWFMEGTTQLPGSGLTDTAASADWTVAGTGDFNADGLSDILWRHKTDGRTSIWFMDGTERLPGSGLTSAAASVSYALAATGDFDADGATDILWRHKTSGITSIWFMQSTTRLDGSGPTDTAASAGWVVRGTGDFNADGRADILWRHSTDGRMSIWFMEGRVRLDESGVLPPFAAGG